MFKVVKLIAFLNSNELEIKVNIKYFHAAC